jgi:signal transduction histidine kinase
MNPTDPMDKGSFENQISQLGKQLPLKPCKEVFQELLDNIPVPCFLYTYDRGYIPLINCQLANLLGFSSVQEFYQRYEELKSLFIKKRSLFFIEKIIDKLNHSKFSRITKRKLFRIDGTAFDASVFIKPLIDGNNGTSFGILGQIGEYDKDKAYQIDKSLIHIFNEDKYNDEVIVILDFNGDVLASNKKSYMIDFCFDFSNRKFNLFKSIDPSYLQKFLGRLEQLKKGIPLPPTEYKLTAKNGKSAYVELFSKPTLYEGKKTILTLIRDITTRKEVEKKLLYTVVQTEEKERQRFAQDLHDELGPFLSGLKLYLNELSSRETDSKRRKMLLDYLGRMTNEAVDKIRSIAGNMMPQNMIEIGLSGSLEKRIEELNQTGKIHISYETEGNETGIEQSFIITLYRIVLELVNNSLKHSGADKINIRIVFRNEFVELNYQDNGKGFDLKKTIEQRQGGIGIKSILNRIELFRGTYKFRNPQSGGIEFELFFPMK